MSAAPITGSCLCGALRFEAKRLSDALTHCHCSTCRKHHGAPFASWVSCSMEDFRWTSGQASLGGYHSSGHRNRLFCRDCGSSMPTLVGDEVQIPAGNLESVGPFSRVRSRETKVEPKHELERTKVASVSSSSGSASQSVKLEGGCLCGVIRFAVSGSPRRWLNCHCSRCRRGRSAAHASNAFFIREHFTWHGGADGVRKYQPTDAARFVIGFCGGCGGAAPVEQDSTPFVLVPVGLLDEELSGHPEGHIFVESKASWYEIEDALPEYAELPGA